MPPRLLRFILLAVCRAAEIAVAQSFEDVSTSACDGFGIRLELWSRWPPLFVARNVTSPADAELLRSRAALGGALAKSRTLDGNGDAGNGNRNSSTASFTWATYTNDALFARVERRITELAKCVYSQLKKLSSSGAEVFRYSLKEWRAVARRENFAITHHAEGQHYKMHLDDTGEKVGRAATLLLYLSSVAGGETVFPNLLPQSYTGPTAEEIMARYKSLSHEQVSGDTASNVNATRAYLFAMLKDVQKELLNGQKLPARLQVHAEFHTSRRCLNDPMVCSEELFAKLRSLRRIGTFTSGMEFCCCSDTLRVPPSSGAALIFFPALHQMQLFHGSCPPKAGGQDKWIAQQWFRMSRPERSDL